MSRRSVAASCHTQGPSVFFWPLPCRTASGGTSGCMWACRLRARAAMRLTTLAALALPFPLAPLVASGCNAGTTTADESEQRACRAANTDASGACRFHDGRFAPSKCCAATPAEHRCNVVWVNEDLNAQLLEEGLGS